MELRKSIGKMGHVVRHTATMAYYDARNSYNTNKPKVKKAVKRGLDYAERVRDNTEHSAFLGGTTQEQRRKHKHKKATQTIIIQVNNQNKRRHKRKRQQNQYSLI